MKRIFAAALLMLWIADFGLRIEAQSSENPQSAASAFVRDPSVKTANELAREFYAAGRGEEGLLYFTKAREEALRGAGHAAASSGVALMLHFLYRWNEAVLVYREAATEWENLGDRLNASRCLLNMGLMFTNLGDYPKSLEPIETALATSREEGHLHGQLLALSHIGRVLGVLGEHEKAFAAYAEALRLSERMGDPVKSAYTLHVLGMLYGETGAYEKALESYLRSMALSKAAGDVYGAANSVLAAGGVHERLGDRDAARRLYMQSLEDFRSIGNDLGAIYAHLALGRVALEDGDHDAALAHYESALAASETFEHPEGKANVLMHMGGLFFARDDYAKAAETFRGLLAHAEALGHVRFQAETLAAESRALTASGRPEGGFPPARRALALAESLGAPESLLLAHFALAGAYTAQMRNSEFGMRNKDGKSEDDASSIPHSAFAIPHSEALRHLRVAVDIIEGMRSGLSESEHKSGFLGTKLTAYEELVELLIADFGLRNEEKNASSTNPQSAIAIPQSEEAFSVAERMKARSFLDELGAAKFSRAGVPEELLREKRALEARIKWLRERAE